MILTRQEKENLIIDLYDQGQTYKEIARTARVSVRDIRPVLKKAEKEREKKLGLSTQKGKDNDSDNNQRQKLSIPSQAYQLFSEGKTPLEVAIQLNLREGQVTKYYLEHWRLKGLYSLNRMYVEIRDEILVIAKLYRRIKRAGIGIEQAVNLIRKANYDLPTIEQKFQQVEREVNSLELRKSRECKALQKLENNKASLIMLCQEETATLNHLRWKIIRQKRFIERFKDDAEYLKIKKIVEQWVSRILLDGKPLLRIALKSLIESMRRDPGKYMPLVYYGSSNDDTSAVLYRGEYYTSYFSNGKHPYQYNTYDFYEDLESMLLEETNKLYKHLLKVQVNGIIVDLAFNNDSSLPPTTLPAKLAYRFSREVGMSRSEIDGV